MTVKDAAPDDFPEIARIHDAMGLDYRLPDLSNPLFFVRKVAENGGGGIMGACFLQLAAECYLWLPPNLEPRDKVTVMKALQPEVLKAAWANGLDRVEARIPAEVERRFEKRLRLLGWTPDRAGWRPWSIECAAR